MNTDAQAAAKLGLKPAQVKYLRRTRQLPFVDMGHRTKRTTDAAIEEYKVKRTRGAI